MPLVEDIRNSAQNIVNIVREPLLILDATRRGDWAEAKGGRDVAGDELSAMPPTRSVRREDGDRR
jgi:hypothetical protein